MTHGAIVAVQTANPATPNQLWPMFFFGFGFLLCFTQVQKQLKQILKKSLNNTFVNRFIHCHSGKPYLNGGGQFHL